MVHRGDDNLALITSFITSDIDDDGMVAENIVYNTSLNGITS